MDKRELVNMGKTQKRSAAMLIREECVNCFQGQCLPLDTACPQLYSDSLLCKWFRDVVLPLNKELLAQVMGVDALKSCASCGRMFRALSNRAKYCKACAAKERRKKDAERKYRSRHAT